MERAFVATVAVDAVPLADGVTDAGERVHVEFSGAPEQVKATGETNPFRPVTVTAKVVVPPAATLAEVGVTARLNGAVDEMPVPVRTAVCGELASLSATLSVAVAVATVVGVKVTLMVQLAATASVVPQVVVWAKDEDDVPPIVMAMPVTVAALLLVRVTVLAALVVLMVWLPKSTVVGFRNTVAGAAVPVPESETICGLVVSLSAMLRATLSVVVVLGVKITVIEQVVFAASVAPHVEVPWVKSVASGPVNETAMLLRREAELLNRVTVLGELGVLTI